MMKKYEFKFIFKYILLAILPLLAVSCTPQPRVGGLASQEKSIVTIRQTDVRVELAATPSEKSRGLSGRENLAPDAGMLFVFEKSERCGFWMKDMKFPLDIVWIADNRIVDIKSDLPPPESGELETYYPQAPANYVLEVNAGFAARHGWQVGDKVEVSL